MDESPQPTVLAEKIARRLAIYLGPNTGRIAVKTFAQKALGRGPDTLLRADVPALNAALRPMLRTMVGRDACELILLQILGEAGL